MSLLPAGMKLSIRVKLTLLIESFVIILVLVAGFIVTEGEKATLETELRKRGLSLTSELAEFIVKPLLSQDAPTLRRFVNHTMEQDYVRYVVVLDPRGKVLMHSNLSEVGKTYADGLSTSALSSGKPGFTDRRNPTGKEWLCDMFSPIRVSGVRLGTVLIGYSHAAVEKEIAQVQRQMLFIGLCTTAAGGLAAYFLAAFISAPIKRIITATEEIARGNLDTRLMINRQDEIGVLANTFNNMTEDLKRTTVSKDYFDNVIESMNDTLIVTDPLLKIRTVNRATCDLLQYTKDELLGMDISCVLPEAHSILGSPESGGPSRDRTVTNQETCYVMNSGKEVPMLFSSAVLRHNEGGMEGIVCIAKDITENRKAEEALRRSERELHFLSSQLLTAQEKERKRLSVELHDELGQSLMVLKLKMRAIREELHSAREDLRAGCDDALGYLNEVTENVRRISRDLSPSILEDLGLSAAIRRLVHTFSRHSGIECSLDAADIDRLFAEEEGITIYRMFQECLTNVMKHAEATRVSLTIESRGDSVFLCVEDNGSGFDPQEADGRTPGKKGLGLAALHQRTRMLGGTFELASREGAGTKISFVIPLAAGRRPI